jgi:hypothetical protein
MVVRKIKINCMEKQNVGIIGDIVSSERCRFSKDIWKGS